MSVLFGLVLLLPSLDFFLHYSPRGLLTEKRDAAPFPPLQDFTSENFERAFNDRFGLRDLLVHNHNWIKAFIFGVSPTSTTIMGKSGWFYLSASMKDYRGMVDFSPRIDRWLSDFSARDAYLAEHGVVYLLVIAPNKESTYPEFLPDQIKQVRAHTRMDQLCEALKKQHKFEWLDLRGPILAHKAGARDPLFHPTDSHWSDSGALIAATEIVNRLRQRWPDLPAVDPRDYERIAADNHGGDLALSIGFPDQFREYEVSLRPRKATVKMVPPPPWAAPYHWSEEAAKYYECDAPGRTRRAVLSADSFGIALSPLLAAQFQRIVYRRTLPLGADANKSLTRLVNWEHPDVYIELFTERFLAEDPKRIFGE